MRTKVRDTIFGCLTTVAFAWWGGVVPADEWPQWRGPTGDGLCHETDLPSNWSEGSGVRWKCRLPEWGNSTPVVWGDAIFLTSHVDDQALQLLRIDKRSGRVVWTREVGRGSAPIGTSPWGSRGKVQFHREHNLASPSPVTDGKLVVVHFGNGDLAGYDFDGKKLWGHNLQEDHGSYTNWWGRANSPVLCGNLVISVCLQDSCRDLMNPPAPSYVIAHDKRTGREVWKAMRMTEAKRMEGDSYITPILRQVGGRTELVVAGGEWLDAYDPTSGARLWYLPGLSGKELARSPIAAHGMIFIGQGLNRNFVAVRPRGEGELKLDDIVWSYGTTGWDVSSPVVVQRWAFLINNAGIACCFDTATGRVMWKERLTGSYRASPIAADGRLYFLNTQGLTTVIAASGRFEKLGENQLDDETYASPAVSDGEILLRGRKWLYCIGR